MTTQLLRGASGIRVYDQSGSRITTVLGNSYGYAKNPMTQKVSNITGDAPVPPEPSCGTALKTESWNNFIMSFITGGAYTLSMYGLDQIPSWDPGSPENLAAAKAATTTATTPTKKTALVEPVPVVVLKQANRTVTALTQAEAAEDKLSKAEIAATKYGMESSSVSQTPAAKRASEATDAALAKAQHQVQTSAVRAIEAERDLIDITEKSLSLHPVEILKHTTTAVLHEKLDPAAVDLAAADGSKLAAQIKGNKDLVKGENESMQGRATAGSTSTSTTTGGAAAAAGGAAAAAAGGAAAAAAPARIPMPEDQKARILSPLLGGLTQVPISMGVRTAFTCASATNNTFQKVSAVMVPLVSGTIRGLVDHYALQRTTGRVVMDACLVAGLEFMSSSMFGAYSDWDKK